MSIVIAYASIDHIIIKCDGRECDTDTNKIVSEGTIKIRNIGKNCLIGYTGIKQYCECAVELFKTVLNGKDPFLNIKIFQDLLLNSYNETNKFKAYFIITGIYNNKIVLWYLSSENGFKNIENNSPSIECPEKYVTIGSKEINTAIQFCDFYNNSLTIENNMNNYIKYISSLSYSVNDHITTKEIKLQ